MRFCVCVGVGVGVGVSARTVVPLTNKISASSFGNDRREVVPIIHAFSTRVRWRARGAQEGQAQDGAGEGKLFQSPS